MTLEQFTNFGSTYLSSSINNSVTSITISSASTFPSVVNYRVVIDTEIMLVTAGAGTTTWTVTRGYEGSTAASHSTGAIVALAYTKGNLSQFTQDRCLCPVAPVIQNTPDTSVFSWINQPASSTFDQTNGVLCLSSVANGSQATTAKAIPTAPYTVTINISFSLVPSGSSATAGVVLLDNSSNGILAFWSCAGGGNLDFDIHRYNSFNTNTLSDQTTLFNPFTKIESSTSNLFNIQITDNNAGTRKWNMTWDGFHYETLYSGSSSQFITATKIGLYAQSSNSWPARINALSWVETSP